MADLPRFPLLDKQRVPHLPPAGYYVADFITEEEEALLLRKIDETPQPKWKTVGTGRRLQYWGGTLSKKNVLVPEPMPDFLTAFPEIIQRIDAFLDIASDVTDKDVQEGKHALGINQVLVNEYKPGQGIAPHEDGPAFRPLVATLSLGSHTVLDLHHYVSPTTPSPPMVATASLDPEGEEGGGKAIAAVPLGHVLLLPRSLFVLSGNLYQSHLHGIAERDNDTCVAPGVVTEAVAGAGGEVKAAEVDAGAEGLSVAEITDADADGNGAARPVVVANAALLARPDIESALANAEGWTRERGTRTSLTFRRAERVLKGGAFSMIGGRMQRA